MKVAVRLMIALTAFCPSARAIHEQHFERSYRAEVWPYYETGEFGSFTAEDGACIAFAAFKTTPELGALVISPGKSESFLKYAELIYDLQTSGYSLYLMDHRGMGFSSALLSRAPEKSHVEDFDDYVRDLGHFIDRVVDAKPHPTRVLFGHSMGAIVAMLFIESHPGVFDGVILSAPMLRIITSPLPEVGAGIMSELAVRLGLGDRYCPTCGPWKLAPFAGNPFTQSHERWSLWEEQLIPSHELTGMGGPTQRWLRESMRAGRRALRDAWKIDVPVVLLQAGRDALVKPQAQAQACKRMPNCELMRFPTSRHEIFLESDSIRDLAVERIRRFLDDMSAYGKVPPARQ